MKSELKRKCTQDPIGMAEEIDRLAKLCTAKDKELQAATAMLQSRDDEQDSLLAQAEMALGRANSQIAMLRQALNNELEQNEQLVDADVREFSYQALSATSEDAEAWLREEKAKVLENLKGVRDKWTLVSGAYWYESIMCRIAELRKNGGK